MDSLKRACVGGERGHSDKAVAIFPKRWAGCGQHDKWQEEGGRGGKTRQAKSGQLNKSGGGLDNMRQVGGWWHNKRVVVAAVDDGGTLPCRLPLTLMPSRFSRFCAGKMRGGDSLSSKPQSNQRWGRIRVKWRCSRQSQQLDREVAGGCGGGGERWGIVTVIIRPRWQLLATKKWP